MSKYRGRAAVNEDVVLALGTFQEPLGTLQEPLGIFQGPLGTFQAPLGTFRDQGIFRNL